MKALKFDDRFKIDLSQIKKERVERFIRAVQDNDQGALHKPPVLVVSVAATHAGIITRNNAFYRPDVMSQGLKSFTTPYAKPVQLHHSDHADPIGRVRTAAYQDISHRYEQPLRDFRERFGGKTFVDAKTDTDQAFDQVKWVMKNLTNHKDYQGLGFGQLDLHISDAEAAEKILDERYLTVSVGFTTTEAYCSDCKQDWANEGPCEHKPGEMIDGLPMVLVPGNFNYDEVSWVNNPADQFAQTIQVSQVSTGASLVDNHTNQPLPEMVPILVSAGQGGIYRLDSFKDVEPTRAKEIQDVAARTETKPGRKVPEGSMIKSANRRTKKRKRGDKVEDYDVLVVKVEDSDVELEFPIEVEDLIFTKDAKMVHYLTTEDGSNPHMHRAILDPATHNGHTSYDDEHSHGVLNKVIQEGGKKEYDSDSGEFTFIAGAAHTHELDKKVEALTDSTKDSNPSTVNDPSRLPKKTGDPSRDIGEIPNGGNEPGQDPANPPVIQVDPRKVTIRKLGSDETQEIELAEDQKREDYAAPDGWEIVEPEAAPEVELSDAVKAKDFYEEYMIPELDKMAQENPELYVDARLTAEQRKKLKGSTFCGPDRSFPVPDCAHVTAARRLIGRFKGSDSEKKKILACVNRRARSMKCGSSKDSVEPILISIPLEDNQSQEVRLTSADDLATLVSTLTPEQIDANKDNLVAAGKVFGVGEEIFDSNTNRHEEAEINTHKTPLEERIRQVAAEASSMGDASFVDSFVLHLSNMDEGRRENFVDALLEAFIDKDWMPDFNQEFNDLNDEVSDLREQLAALQKTSRDLYQERQSFLAEKIVDLNVALKREGFVDLTDDEKSTLVSRYKIRSIDSLNNTVDDLVEALANGKVVKPGLDDNTNVPSGTLQLNDSENEPKETPKDQKVDTRSFKGCSDATYQLARRLQAAYTGSKTAE